MEWINLQSHTERSTHISYISIYLPNYKQANRTAAL